MELQSGVQLGSVANLLNGYQPGWNPGDPTGTPLFAPPNPLVNSYPADIPDNPATWSYPVITLHPTIQDLVSTLYAFSVVPLHDDASPPVFPSGPLTLNDADQAQALQTLGTALGLDVSDPSLSYMLVRLTRQVGTAQFSAHHGSVFVGRRRPTAHIQRGLQVALGRLRAGDVKLEPWMTGRLVVDDHPLADPTLADVADILTFFANYGTHYVSSITGGDVIYQVFAYQAERFQQLQQAYTSSPGQTSGPAAVGWDYYTTPVNGPYGFASAAGSVIAMSADTAFEQSVQAGQWNDPMFAHGNSVFHAYQDGTTLNLNDFTQVVPIALELSSLTNFAEPLPKDTLRRVFKAAMYQKYGDAITPAFEKPATYDYAAIFPQPQAGFVSTLATPSVDVYKQRLDLSDVQLMAPQEVTSFTLFTNVLELTGTAPLAVPGTAVTLVSHVVDVPDPLAGVPTLQLADAAYGSWVLACQEFGGPLNLVNTSGTARNVIVDGFRYGVVVDPLTGRWNVQAQADVRVPPPAAALAALQADIDMSLTGAETVLFAGAADTPTGRQGRALILKFLNWIGLAIPATTTDPAVLELRVRALYLARVDAKLRFQGSPVPYLTYAAYQPVIDATLSVLSTVTTQVQDAQLQIQLRKLAELQIDVATELNQNIVQTGELLTGLIGSMAQQQSDMAGYYGGIMAQQQQQLEQAESQVGSLAALLTAQQNEVSQQVIAYQDAVSDWETMQIVSFALDLAGAIFSLGTALTAPAGAGTAVAEAAGMAEKIKKLNETFEALNTIYQTLLSGIDEIEKAQDALSAIGYDGAQFPTALEWQELNVNMGVMLDTGPDVPAKAELKGAFEILVLRGQALLAAQATVQQIGGEIYLNAKRQQMAQAQQAQLSALQGYLHPVSITQLDLSKIDLLGLTGPLLSVQQQMLAMLGRSLELQNEALRYEYLQQPVAVPAFDLLSLKQVMLAQKQAILNGLAGINPPPEPLPAPVTYTIRGVPTAQLTGGSVFQFSIPLSAREFYRYAMVRVNRVVASVTGVEGTGSGQYLLQLDYSGNPFFDRDQNRATLEFVTPAREIQYLYDAQTGQPLFGTGVGSWQESISRITPFSDWQASFPTTSANQGITFTGATVDLTLSFDLVVLLRDPPTLQPGARDGALAMLAAAEAQPSLTQVLQEMNQIGTVMNGWDVVFTMSEDLVNEILLQQYNNRENDSTFFDTIPTTTVVGAANPTTGNSVVTTFGLTLGTPEVQFLENNPGSVQLAMDIVSGTYGWGISSDGGQNVTWVTPVAAIEAGGQLQATVPLAQVQGSVNQQNVVLQLSQGAFTSTNTTITNSDNPDFNAALTSYMAGTSQSFLINTLDLSNNTTLAGLTPTQFQINTTSTASGISILQLFITTDGAPASALSLAISEPLPVGYDCSLLISSRILFADVFVESFTSGSSALTVTSVAPSGPSLTAPYSAQVSGGSFSAEIPPTNDVRISADSNTVTLGLSGMTFTTSAGGSLQASFNQTFTQGFQYQTCTPIICDGVSCAWNDASLPVQVQTSFSMPIGVTGTGNSQGIQIQTTPASITLTPTLDSSGPCTCNNREVQEELATQMNADVPGPLSTAVNMQFSSVSVFALENLLFPNDNYITLSSANAPGDMAVFGTISVPTS